MPPPTGSQLEGAELLQYLQALATGPLTVPSTTTDRSPEIPSEDILQALYQDGFATREVLENLFTCALCLSTHLTVLERCSRCASVDVDPIDLIHHLECAGVFPAHNANEKNLMCTKCGAAVLHGSPSFEQCGTLHHCHACGANRPETRIEFRCEDCGYSSAAVETQKRKTFRFSISERGKALLQGVLPKGNAP